MNNFRHVTKTLVTAAASAILLAGCNSMAVHGTGQTLDVEHDIRAPGKVEINGSGELHLKNGRDTRLIVVAQQEIHDHLRVYHEGDTLIIEPEDGFHFRTDEPVQYILISNDVSVVALSGAVNLMSDEYTTDNLTIDTSGSSDIDATFYTKALTIDASGAFDGYLAGETETLTLDFSGASDLNSFDMKAMQVDIDLSGAGKVYVSASDTLNVSVAGASTVAYKGNPRVSQSSSGASRVYNAD